MKQRNKGLLCILLAIMYVFSVSIMPVYATEVPTDPNAVVSDGAQKDDQKPMVTSGETGEEGATTEEATTTEQPTTTEKPATTEEPEKPEVVQMNLKFTQNGTKITVDATTVKNAKIYEFSVKENSGSYKTIASTKSAKVNFTARSGILYTVKVMAKNEGGELVGNSKGYQVCLPKAVTSVKTAGQSKTRVKLTWTKAQYANLYKIYRKENGKAYVMVAETKGSSCTDNKIKYGKNYTYKIVSYMTSSAKTWKGAETTKGFCNKKIVATGHKKYSYSEMKTDIEQLSRKYDGMVSYRVLGKSLDKRNIYDVMIGNPKAKKTLLVVSTMHAREYMATLVTMNQIEYYLQNYNNKVSGTKISTTLNKICIHVVPMANPDGVTIAQSGIGKIKSASLRAKLRKISRGGTSRWKANARGVDLNRNWGYRWVKSGRPSASGYSGKSVHSEPEVKALVKIKKELKNNGTLRGTISYHTMGNILFGKCTKKSIKSTTRKMYSVAKKTTGYSCADYVYGGKGIGNSREWDMYRLVTPSITIEVGRNAAPGPISEFPAIWRKIKTS